MVRSKASVIDGEAATDVAQRLQQELGAGRSSRRGRGLLLAATIAWHLGDAEGPAQEWVEQFLLVQPGDLQAQCLRAWLQLYVTAAAAGGGGKGMRAGEEEEEEGKGVVEISSRAEEDINSKQHSKKRKRERALDDSFFKVESASLSRSGGKQRSGLVPPCACVFFFLSLSFKVVPQI